MSLRTRLAVGAMALGLVSVQESSVSAQAVRDRVREVTRIRVGAGGYLGVQLVDVHADDLARLKLAEERGALVKSVEGGSPAEKAGVKPDDVILRWQGEAVGSVAHLVRLVRETPSGRKVALEVSRAGTPQKLTATLEDRPGARWLGDFDFDFAVPELHALPAPPEPPDPPVAPLLRDRMWFRGPRKLGVRYQEVEGQLAEYFHLAGKRGVLVTHVEDDGPASRAGLKAGDLILKLGGRAIDDTEDFQDAVRDAEPGKEIAVTVQREGKPLELRLKVGGEAGRPTRGARGRSV